MDELEILKKDWNKEKPDKFREYTPQELFEMIKNKSISVSKSLLIMGVLEICIWGLYSYFYFHEEDFWANWNIIPRIPVFLAFILFLIISFKNIKNEVNTKKLMKQILMLRKIIITYIIFIISSIVIFHIIDFEEHSKSAIAGFVDGWNQAPCESDGAETEKMDMTTGYILFGISFIIFIAVLAVIYRKTYGRLLKKLKQNYNDLNNSNA